MKGWYDLQMEFSELFPYQIFVDINGTRVNFSENFLMELREFLTTGCALKMSQESFDVTSRYIKYCDGEIDSDDVLVALDSVLVDIVNCRYESISSQCALNSNHSFNSCGV